MATSTNYGWAEPDNSSLVKNGASDMRTLGNAIDTSVWNVGFGQAGKNKIINGDFSINQRSFTSTTTNGTYGFDRFVMACSGGTNTYSAQTFTTGSAPVAGYEAANFARLVTTGQAAAGDFAALRQAIENVRTFAGQTVTVSFWAKASTGTPKVGIQLNQFFGSGGSADVFGTAILVTLNTSWTRYTATVNVPSIVGKTVGTGSILYLWLMTSVGTTISGLGYPAVGLQNATIDFWGVQVEYGSVATPFQTASGGSPQQELAMCQRYYWRQTALAGTAYTRFTGFSPADSTTQIGMVVQNPVPMRVQPSSVDYGNLTLYSGAFGTLSTIALASDNNNLISLLTVTGSGLTQYRPYALIANASASAYLGLSAEL